MYSTVYLLLVVQELISYPDGTHDIPSRLLESYDLEELLAATRDYQERVRRQKRQASPLNDEEGVYIAANVTEEDLRSGFELGDGRTYGDFTNHLLNPGHFYNLMLRGVVSGTDTPISLTLSDPLSECRPPTCTSAWIKDRKHLCMDMYGRLGVAK